MHPKFKNKRKVLIFRITVIAFFIWLGIFGSLGAKEGYLIYDWIDEMQDIYIPLLKENMYGLTNPLWWIKYKNEFLINGILIGFVGGVLVLMYHESMQLDLISGKEHGTAEYADPFEINKQLQDTEKKHIYKEEIYVRKWYRFFLKTKIVVEINMMNRRITENVYMSMDSRRTDRNNNIFVVGGSGAGKTFKFSRNILRQMNGTYIVTDPKGELAKKEGGYLKKRGYDVKVLNLLNIKGMLKSIRYNPLHYVENDMDVVKLATNIMTNTKPKDAGTGGDPFFEGAASKLLQALIHYTVTVYKDNSKKKNFRTIMELLAMANFEIDPETMSKKDSELDMLFRELEDNENRRIKMERKQGKIPRAMNPAVVKYNSIMRGAADTVRSIVITLDERLANLHVEELLDLLSEDEINIPELGMGKNYDGKTKTALFLCIPDTDKSFNFIVGMLYTQIVQVLYNYADEVCDGSLPISVTKLMDEFANVALPEDFSSVLSTERSRNMNSIIILQNLAQIKKLFEKDWESITGNCDTFIYLGGNEKGSHEYVSEMMGKGTYNKRTTGETLGTTGSASKNYDVVGRELLTPEELRRLNRKKCIVLISGLAPIMDYKIQTDKHPLFKYIKENFVFDRRDIKKGGMYFAAESYYEHILKKDKEEDTNRVLTINGDALMSLSSEAINNIGKKGWYEELTEELILIDVKKAEERKKEEPLSDEELSKLSEKELQTWLTLRSEGYSDRQIKVINKMILSGKTLEETVKMFPASLEANRMEKLSVNFIKEDLYETDNNQKDKRKS